MEKVQLSQSQYDAFAAGEITKSFEQLDLNNDGTITNEDLALAGNSSAKSQITTLLNKAEEDSTLKEFSLDSINELVAAQATKAGTRTGAANNTSNLNIEIVDIDVSNLKKEPVTNINEKLMQVLRNIKAIEDKIQKLLDEQVENENNINQLGTERTSNESSLETANGKVETEQNTLDRHLKEYETIQEEIERKNNEIRTAQNLEEANYQEHISDVIKRANTNYNPQEHGSNFESYFYKQLNNAGYVMFADVENLNDEAEFLSSNAKSVMNQIRSQSEIVATAAYQARTAKTTLDTTNSKISTANNKIIQNNSNLEAANKMLETQEINQTKITHELSIRTTDGGLTPAEVLGQIEQTEKDYAKELGWNIKNCVIAKGADGKFHIYNPTICYDGANPSSVREHYRKTTGSPYTADSYAEIPSGSGFLTPGFTNITNDTKGRAMYVFTSVNEDWTDGETNLFNSSYQTCSPLAFDTDGNGFSTSSQRISYDINGDGTKDIINNSNDWVLAFDKDKNGISGADGTELFGNNTDLDNDGKADGYANGFEALKALARKEGLISENDNVLNNEDIEKLSKKYNLKMMKGYNGESKSLADLGITQINLAQTTETSLNKNFDGQQNDLMTQEGATFVINGKTQEYADLWNKVYDTPKTLAAGKDIEAETGNLNFNLKKVSAEKGEVDYDKIQRNQTISLETDTILEEVLEIKEEEEEEEEES